MQNAAKILNTPGKIAVIPTDTVYGVVARAKDPEAVAKLYKLKRRERKPGTLIAATIKGVEELGIKHRYLKAVEDYWPGPISVLIPTSDPKLNYLTQGLTSLAVRIPKDQPLNELLSATGPLITSSANLPGEPPAKNIKGAKEYFEDRVDYYQDGGELDNEPSTIIRIVDDAVEVIRPGAYMDPKW
ncbi:MAG TPA: L-threonylcarbamoyladenylate synthase [Candidatus Sulfotelmatobacter sp.]|nr:L-threonylcarbamoyladenylate synthase [Candidatus Sulfotelmatobacter sp.]